MHAVRKATLNIKNLEALIQLRLDLFITEPFCIQMML